MATTGTACRAPTEEHDNSADQYIVRRFFYRTFSCSVQFPVPFPLGFAFTSFV
jgi:hypothetical protein